MQPVHLLLVKLDLQYKANACLFNAAKLTALNLLPNENNNNKKRESVGAVLLFICHGYVVF